VVDRGGFPRSDEKCIIRSGGRSRRGGGGGGGAGVCFIITFFFIFLFKTFYRNTTVAAAREGDKGRGSVFSKKLQAIRQTSHTGRKPTVNCARYT